MTAPALTSLLRQLADFAEIRGGSAGAPAWRRLADDIDRLGEDEITRLGALAKLNRLTELTAFPRFLHPTLRDLLLGRADMARGAALASLPWLLRRLLESATLDSAGAATLARHGILTLVDLEGGLSDGRVAIHFPDQHERLRAAAERLTVERTRQPLGRALDMAANFITLVEGVCPEVQDLVAAGDVRRIEPLVDSLVIVGNAPHPPAVLEQICTMPGIHNALHQSARRALVHYQQVEVDVRIAARDEYGSTLHLATGSMAHVGAVRARARGARLSAREEEVYSHAGLAWIAPEMRHDTGEVEAAAAGTLPRLVTRDDIRGDLHMHTTYSDGRDSLVEMVRSAAGLGYEYIAITDHSARAGASRTVTIAALSRQRDEIARVREQFPGLSILHGIEVDIMPDGRLDFDDATLASLDVVLASLHDHAGHDAARLTKRCLAAIRHPLVNVITHPSNRLVGRDEGYDLAFPAVYAAAAETGTALEIDGAPSHLDMDGAHAREAVAAGVTVTIDSDCHIARLLDRQMRLGVGTARRGWVEARHVLNTRPLADVRAFIAAKRRAGG